MNHQKAKQKQRLRRRHHVRRSITGTPERPRLSVFRSSKHIYAQLIDDLAGRLRTAKAGGYEWVTSPFLLDLVLRKPQAM